MARLIGFSWPRPSPCPLAMSLPAGGGRAEGAEYSGSGWEAQAEGGCLPWTDGVLGARQNHSRLSPGVMSSCLKHSGENPTFLTVGWVIRVWGPVFFRSLPRRDPTSVCIIIAQTGLFSGLVGDKPAWVLLRWGGGVVFLKATSYVCPVLLFPSCLPPCCSASPHFSQPPLPEFLESTFAIFVFALGRVFPFHLMLYL